MGTSVTTHACCQVQLGDASAKLLTSAEVPCWACAARSDGGKVLLLRKKGGKHGPGKWQMPGGGSDSKDADALATAEREALEEVGGVPSHSVVGQIELKKCVPAFVHVTLWWWRLHLRHHVLPVMASMAALHACAAWPQVAGPAWHTRTSPGSCEQVACYWDDLSCLATGGPSILQGCSVIPQAMACTR